jgi:hypothetical protein
MDLPGRGDATHKVALATAQQLMHLRQYQLSVVSQTGVRCVQEIVWVSAFARTEQFGLGVRMVLANLETIQSLTDHRQF